MNLEIEKEYKSKKKTQKKCEACRQILEINSFAKKTGKKLEYLPVCKNCEAQAIMVLKNNDNNKNSQHTKAVEVMYKNYEDEVGKLIFHQFNYLEDIENHKFEMLYKIFYNDEGKEPKIKTYDLKKGTFKNWLITIIKNESKNKIGKETIVGDARINSNKKIYKKKSLVDILTASFSNKPISTRRNNSLTDDEWNTVFKEIYQTNPEGNLNRKRIQDCVKDGLKRFRMEKTKNWRAIQFTMQEMPIKDMARELNKSIANTRVFISESRKKLEPFIKNCL